MNRRVFLKATGVGLVHPTRLLTFGPALVRQGNRRLKDITPDELMELLAWADIDVENLMTVEEAKQDRGKPIASLHPEYYFEYAEENFGTSLEEKIWFRYWWCDYEDEYPEWEEAGGCIKIGAVWGHYGYAIPSPLEVVKWFLSHGFKVW
jgi:hypothetical protein